MAKPNHKSQIINPKLKDLPGGTTKAIGNESIVGKRKRFDSLKIFLPARVKFIDMLEKTKF